MSNTGAICVMVPSQQAVSLRLFYHEIFESHSLCDSQIALSFGPLLVIRSFLSIATCIELVERSLQSDNVNSNLQRGVFLVAIYHCHGLWFAIADRKILSHPVTCTARSSFVNRVLESTFVVQAKGLCMPSISTIRQHHRSTGTTAKCRSGTSSGNMFLQMNLSAK